MSTPTLPQPCAAHDTAAARSPGRPAGRLSVLGAPVGRGRRSLEPARQGRIHPGVQMYTKGMQCTGNFVFKDRKGRVYVGYAVLPGTGGATDTNGCAARSLPLGTRVRFAEGGSAVDGGTTGGRGRLAYSPVAHHAQARHQGREHLRLQRLRAREGRQVRPRQGEPERAVLGRAHGSRPGRDGRGRDRPLVRSSATRGGDDRPAGRSKASASALWSRVEPPGLCGDTGPPRGTRGSAFLDGKGRAHRDTVDDHARPLAGVQRRERPAS